MAFNPLQKGRNISALDSTRNIMSDQPSFQSVFNQSVQQSLSNNYDKNLANAHMGVDTANPILSSLNFKQRSESQVEQPIPNGATSTSAYPKYNFTNKAESSKVFDDSLRPKASEVSASSNSKSTVPTNKFHETQTCIFPEPGQ